MYKYQNYFIPTVSSGTHDDDGDDYVIPAQFPLNSYSHLFFLSSEAHLLRALYFCFKTLCGAESKSTKGTLYFY